MSEITVLVPSYNHAPYVERTLRSIFGQTLRPRKLIVIDDGSKDESVTVIERVLAECPFECELIARENRGLCGTLNEGFALCNTEYFAYLGSDDVIISTTLEEQVTLLVQRPTAVLAFGHAYLIDEDDNIIDSTSNWTTFADGDPLPHLLHGQVFSSPGVVYRSSALRMHRWNEEAVLEDYELYLKLAGEGEFARNSNVIGGWRQHGANVSSDAAKMLEEWIAAQDRVADSLPYTREELDIIQRGLRFISASNLVRSGDRTNAFRLFKENIGGASSVPPAVGGLARILTPKRLFEANRERKRRKTIHYSGKIKLDQN